MTEEEREELERLQLEELRYQNRRRKAHQKINRVYVITILAALGLIILTFWIGIAYFIITGLTQY